MDQEKLNNLAGVKLFEKGQDPTKQQTQMVLTLEFEPRPHWWESSALTTVPFLPPFNKKCATPAVYTKLCICVVV